VVSLPRPAPGYALAVPIEVRFKDLDAMGHVNNAVYFTYFENARIAYWTAVGRSRTRGEVTYVVARAECDFRSPVTMEDSLVCHVRIAALGRSSFTFEFLLREERTGRAVATGKTVQVVYDYEARRVRPIDAGLREEILRFEGREIGPATRRAKGGRDDEQG
jgi:acyl-CoA thioester hydrolase